LALQATQILYFATAPLPEFCHSTFALPRDLGGQETHDDAERIRDYFLTMSF
jgi:hypothetical protein